jgi:competence protein ComEA
MPAEFLMKFRLPVLILLGGVAVVSLGILFYKGADYFSTTKVEVLEATSSGKINTKEITVEIAGEVVNPGVYKLTDGSRIEDLLKISGGFTKSADNSWTDKYLNKAAKLADAQKVYIPHSGESSANKNKIDQSMSGDILGQNTSFININTASTGELDKLPGIGPTYAQKIIEQRPYSNIEELLSKKVLNKSTYEKVKSLVSVY